jgi:ABC-type polysaccharide/polyol phosphate transport system ATPase subunit/SAM-dependent methyltransferase
MSTGSLSRPETREPARPASDDVAVRAERLAKTFRIPHEARTTVRDYVIHPFRRTRYEVQRALVDVDFHIPKGEFFGVIGRNGSGKSTLLKVLAGIYAPDQGRVEINGKLSPFIELGVGFNPELSARDNVKINGTLLGLTPREIDERFDSIIEFAELHRFVDQKLKNYSSGMQLRLAYAISIQVPFDILLLDEVLAVGDQNFQDKCFATFEAMRDAGKTVILVTHGLSTVAQFCDRALLLRDGSVQAVGEPGEVIERYLDQERERSLARTPAPMEAETAESGDAAPTQSVDAAADDLAALTSDDVATVMRAQHRRLERQVAQLLEVQHLRHELKATARRVRSFTTLVENLLELHYPRFPLPPVELRARSGSGPDELNYLAQGLAAARKALEEFGAAPTAPILEWGCSTGRTLRWLLAYPEWVQKYYGCDNDAHAIEWLRAQGSFDVVLAAEETLPFEDRSFAGVFALRMLLQLPPEHFRSWFDEACRVLSPGGVVVVATFGSAVTQGGAVTDPYLLRAYQREGWAFSPRSTGPPLALVSEEFIRSAVDGLFEVERFEPAGFGTSDAYRLRRVG